MLSATSEPAPISADSRKSCRTLNSARPALHGVPPALEVGFAERHGFRSVCVQVRCVALESEEETDFIDPN